MNKTFRDRAMARAAMAWKEFQATRLTKGPHYLDPLDPRGMRKPSRRDIRRETTNQNRPHGRY